jgi:uncharacterized protein YigE (DUF2233 family)
VKRVLGVALVAGAVAVVVAFVKSRTGSLAIATSEFRESGVECSGRVIGNARFRVCEFHPDSVDVRLYWKDATGEQIGDFARLREVVRGEGFELLLAMNAGMYGADADSTPVGLYVEGGRELVPLNLRDSTGGNFYDLPNGGFHVADGRAAVMDARDFAQPGVRSGIATQSGPLLVKRGSFPHDGYGPNGPRQAPRNAVGVRADGRVVFVLAETPVNMHELRVALRDQFGCTDALYLDGAISELMVGSESPSLRRYGGILAIVKRSVER